MKIGKLSFDNFKESQLSAVGMRSIKGGILPGGTPGGTVPPGEFEEVDSTDSSTPCSGAPVIITSGTTNSGTIKVDIGTGIIKP